VLGDDRSAARLEVFAACGEGGVGVEQDEGVPREWASGVEGAVATTEPSADLQVRVVQLSDPGVGEDALGIAAALAVALNRLPDSEDAKIGIRPGFEDVVGDPPGPAEAGASSGGHQQHEPTMTRPGVEGLRERGQRARLRRGGGRRRACRARRECCEADNDGDEEDPSARSHRSTLA